MTNETALSILTNNMLMSVTESSSELEMLLWLFLEPLLFMQYNISCFCAARSPQALSLL